MIVADCTVLADFYVGEDAQRLAAHRLLKFDDTWIAPSLWQYELANVFLIYVRAGKLKKTEMALALSEARKLVLETVPLDSIPDVWEFALDNDLSFYDASYVKLAQSRGIQIYTRDGGILRKCPEIAVATSQL